jgi:hypothetical protein
VGPFGNCDFADEQSAFGNIGVGAIAGKIATGHYLQ